MAITMPVTTETRRRLKRVADEELARGFRERVQQAALREAGETEAFKAQVQAQAVAEAPSEPAEPGPEPGFVAPGELVPRARVRATREPLLRVQTLPVSGPELVREAARQKSFHDVVGSPQAWETIGKALEPLGAATEMVRQVMFELPKELSGETAARRAAGEERTGFNLFSQTAPNLTGFTRARTEELAEQGQDTPFVENLAAGLLVPPFVVKGPQTIAEGFQAASRTAPVLRAVLTEELGGTGLPSTTRLRQEAAKLAVQGERSAVPPEHLRAPPAEFAERIPLPVKPLPRTPAKPLEEVLSPVAQPLEQATPSAKNIHITVVTNEYPSGVKVELPNNRETRRFLLEATPEGLEILGGDATREEIAAAVARLHERPSRFGTAPGPLAHEVVVPPETGQFLPQPYIIRSGGRLRPVEIPGRADISLVDSPGLLESLPESVLNGPKPTAVATRAPAVSAPPPAAHLTLGIPGEDNADAAVRKYAGARLRAAATINQWLQGGDDLLRSAGITTQRAGKPMPSMAVADNLLRALHGEIQAAPQYAAMVADMQKIMADETAKMLAADPSFAGRMLAGEYFPRLWQRAKGAKGVALPSGALGRRPFFYKGRVPFTYSEMREAGWEPVSANPYDMLALRVMEGENYREGLVLVDRLKKYAKALPAQEAPEGWRVPRVGPAFEGRPFPTDTGGAAKTQAWAVPDTIADTLESTFGHRPRLPIGSMDVVPWISGANQAVKRVKLIASLFQHLDFIFRTAGEAFSPSAILTGRTLNFPAYLLRTVKGQFSEETRLALQRRWLSNQPMVKGTGITPKMLVEEGANIGPDTMMLRRDIMAWLNDAMQSAPTTAAGKMLDRMGSVNRFFESGLFENIYPLSMEWSAKNHIVPVLKRIHPDWTDRQIAGQAAREINQMYSNLPVWQSVLKSPGAREFFRNLFFSTNEQESWVRQAVSTVHGPAKQMWAEHWLGLTTFMALVAAVIHFASTGKPLPVDRWKPWRNGQYNSDFLSPDLPITGIDRTPIKLDVIGQADTIARWAIPLVAGGVEAVRTGSIDPALQGVGRAVEVGESRAGVWPRAILNQAQGETFGGIPLESAGDRLTQLAADLALPIGAGNLAQIARERIPGASEVIVPQEARLGTAGQALQATGLNLRAATAPEFRQRLAERQGVPNAAQLEPVDIARLENQPQMRLYRRALGNTEAQRKRERLYKLYDQQAARDAQWKAGVLPSSKWIDAYYRGIQEGATLRDVLFEGNQRRVPADLNEKALAGYYDLLKTFEQESTGGFDSEAWRAAEPEYLAGLPAEQREYVKRNLHPNATPLARAFLDDRERLKDYWSINDLITARLPEGPVRNIWQGYLDGTIQRGDSPVLERAIQVQRRVRLRYRLQHPEIEQLLVKWGYVETPAAQRVR